MAKKKPKGPVEPVIEELREKFDNDPTKRKGTVEAIARRRQDVWEMMCQGISKTEIANILGVHRHTIIGDVKYWKKRLARRVARIKEEPDATNIEIGMSMGRLDSLTEAAFQEYSQAKTGSEKDKFLNTAGKMIATKARLLQETGYLPKAGIELKTKVEHQISFSERFGKDSPLSELDDATSRHKILSFAQRLIDAANKAKAIDVEATVTSPLEPEPPQLPAADFLGGHHDDSEATG